MNLAFFYGKQWLEVTAISGGKLIQPKAPPYRVRQTINRIRPAIRTEISRLISQKPTASIIPSSSDDEDLAAAYAGEQLWEAISQKKKYQRELRLTAFWTLICGTGFMKTWWDASTTDEGGNQGDIKFECVTPYHLYVPDLRITDIQEQPYLINVYTRTVAQLQQMYGSRGIDISKMGINSNVVASQEILSDSILNLSGSSKTEPDSVLCYELWAKPGAHKLLPKGGMVQVAGDKVTYWSREGIPYSHGRYPFAKLEHMPTGKFYTESTILDLIGPQREYNRLRSFLIENRNRSAKQQLVAAKGSVEPNKITTEPGQVIFYKPGMPPPVPLQVQNMPPYVMEEQNRILLDIEDISGQHQVSKGSAPPGVTAATAISFLQEKDDSLMATTYASMEEFCEEIAQQTLELVKQYWDSTRTVKTAGEDGSFDVLQLLGSSIDTDIRMEGGSALPTSKAARQAFLMDMMKMGFISPQEGLKLMDMGGVQKLYKTLKVDESQAQRENIKLKTVKEEDIQQHMMQFQSLAMSGDPATLDAETQMPMEPPAIVPVNSWDNHMVHITVHNNFRKTQAFEMLPDVIKTEFEKHVNDHVMAQNDAMMQIQQATGQDPSALMGGPGGSPSGEPPMPTTTPDNAGIAPPEMMGMG
jgi:hypothetical protein